MSGMRFEQPLAELKASLAANVPVFEDLLRSHLLDNGHRALVVLSPESGMAERLQAEEAAVLARVADALSPAEMRALAADAEALRSAQVTDFVLPSLQLALRRLA